MEERAVSTIELAGVTVELGGRVVLQDITLNVATGEFLAVLGPNGAGKTTLLRTILGQVRPSNGEVRVFGKPPVELGKDRARIGYIPQVEGVDPSFPILVKDLVMMGRYARLGLFRRPGRADWQAVEEAMSRVGIEPLANRAIGELSGGEWQRSFLARALAGGPELLFLDEPTAGVDVATSEDLYQQLHDFKKQLGLTIVVVSHDVGVVSQCVDQIACLNRTLVAHGRPSEALTPNTLECMYGRHAMLTGHSVMPHVLLDGSEHETD